MKKKWMNYFRLITLSSVFLLWSLEALAAHRIVVLAPSLAEIVSAIQGEELSENTVVGVSDHTDFPKNLSKKHKVGPYFKPNLEIILSLKPDLVLATRDGNPKSVVDALMARKIRTLVVNTQSLSQIYQSISDVGDALQRPMEAQKILAQVQSKIEEIRKRGEGRKKEKILIQLEHSPLIVAGGTSFLNEMVGVIGAKNIYDNLQRSYPQVSIEDVVAKDPDWIICVAFSQGDQKKFEEMSHFWGKFSQLKAVKKNQVRVVLADTLVRPGPRMIDGIRILEKVVYGF